jgi:hypothetical protein
MVPADFADYRRFYFLRRYISELLLSYLNKERNANPRPLVIPEQMT